MLKYLTVVTAKDIIAETANIPESPGVYAWFKQIMLDETNEENFVASVRDILEYQSWDVEMQTSPGKCGPYSVEIHLKPHAPGLSESKQKIAEQLAKDQQQRAIMKRLVQEASVLQAPLYVGKSQNLSRRISQHLKGQSDFSKKLVHAVHPSQLIVAYIETKDLMVKAEELMEVLVGITASPRYAKRIG